MDRTKEASAIYASVEDLARELGISRHTAYAGLRAGRIPAIRLGRRYILPRAAITKWLESVTAHSPPKVNE